MERVQMSSVERFDAILIGSGQAANPLASAMAEAGRKVALVEREHVGGTCINTGCTPTKTMVASARVAYLARRAGDYGVELKGLHVSMERVRARKRAIVQSFRGGNEKRLKTNDHIELIFGEGSFVDTKTIRVATDAGERLLTANTIFIDTGARNSIPRIDGIQEVAFLDNASAMELATLPDHLVILGGGYIGVEFGQMFRRFGSRVSIVQNGAQLLVREDEDVAEAVRKILDEDGIEIYLNAKAQRVSTQGSGVAVEMKTADGAVTTIHGSHLLLAVGRTPNTEKLNLQAAGIETDKRGFIRVNDQLETNVPGIYALGDVKGGPAFTHISYDDYRVVKANLLQGSNMSIAGRMVPYTVFMDPQLGRIGITEKEARAKGLKVKVAKMPMSSVARALEVDETRGLMKVVVDADTEQILGAAILGSEGGEIASLVQVAMMGKLPYTALRDAIFSHPTLAESMNNIFQKFE